MPSAPQVVIGKILSNFFLFSFLERGKCTLLTFPVGLSQTDVSCLECRFFTLGELAGCSYGRELEFLLFYFVLSTLRLSLVFSKGFDKGAFQFLQYKKDWVLVITQLS